MSRHPEIRISTERPAPIPQYSVEVTPPPYSEYDDSSLNSSTSSLSNPWGGDSPAVETPIDHFTRQRTYSAVEPSTRPLSRSISAGASSIMSPPTMAFPEPQIYRSTSYAYANAPASPISPGPFSPIESTIWNPQNALQPLAAPGLHHSPSMASIRSTASSYHQGGEDDYEPEPSEDVTEDLSRELSNLSMDSDESLRRFQAGELMAKDEEWHLLVPPEAREALGKDEVQRQSVIFEVIKAERDYVADLETVEQVYIATLRSSSPSIVPSDRIQLFLDEVFGNIGCLLAHHRRMLASLFERQRDQHPLVQSVADIILEMVLSSEFRSDYEAYIKHYPLSESAHRREMRNNPAYKRFLSDLPAKHPSFDQRIRKRDLITFISRPVTRLPRLNLVLEQILKLTDKEYDHPDIETLPLILSILGDTVKSTQPGIAAAESKVKFYALSEGLVFQRGEIIEMDLYDDSRTIVYDSPVWRQNRSEFDRTTWTELSASLLDNYFILTKDEKRQNGAERRTIMSRPLPLSYLRLGSFNSPPEQRKEKVDDGGLFRSSQTVPVYPFTIYHAGNRQTRRYTLYVATENVRKKWKDALVDALGVHKVRQESNQFFYQQVLSDKYFRSMGPKVTTPNIRLTGKITTAAPFVSRDRRFIAVGCENGIYVAPMGTEDFHRVFQYMSPTSIVALQTQNSRAYNHLIIHSDANLLSYDLDAVALVSQGKAQSRALEVMGERVISQDAGSVINFNIGFWAHRGMVICTTKKRLQTTTGLYAIEAIPAGKNSAQGARQNKGPVRSFRTYGEPAYVPRDATNITPLTKTVGLSVKENIIVMDPLKLTGPPVNIVPNLDDQNDPSIAILRNRVGEAKPLGLMRISEDELLVVYDTIGCYITKHGLPRRQAGYIKWETTATTYAYRKNFILLLSPNFVEIRDVMTSKIVQVIEGTDVRLLHSDLGPPDIMDPKDYYNIIIAMKGSLDDPKGTSDKIVELVETNELSVGLSNGNGYAPDAALPAMWDEWDM